LLPLGALLLFLIKKIRIPKEVITILLYCVVLFTILKLYPLLKDQKKLYDIIFTFLEYSFFTLFLWFIIVNKNFKKIIIGLSFCFYSFQVVYFIIDKSDRLDSIPVGVETILLFIYIIYFLYEQFKSQRNTYIYNHPGFWIAIGIMIYLGGSFFLYILVNHLDQEQIDKYVQFTYVADILKNIFLVTAICLYLRKDEKTSEKTVPYLDMI
jgi:hypothetical protein